MKSWSVTVATLTLMLSTAICRAGEYSPVVDLAKLGQTFEPKDHLILLPGDGMSQFKMALEKAKFEIVAFPMSNIKDFLSHYTPEETEAFLARVHIPTLVAYLAELNIFEKAVNKTIIISDFMVSGLSLYAFTAAVQRCFTSKDKKNSIVALALPYPMSFHYPMSVLLAENGQQKSPVEGVDRGKLIEQGNWKGLVDAFKKLGTTFYKLQLTTDPIQSMIFLMPIYSRLRPRMVDKLNWQKYLEDTKAAQNLD